MYSLTLRKLDENPVSLQFICHCSCYLHSLLTTCYHYTAVGKCCTYVFILFDCFMMTKSNGNNSVLLALCLQNSPVTGEFASQRPVAQSFDVFFDLLLNKRLSKQSRHQWFETPSPSVWHHCNVMVSSHLTVYSWQSVHMCYNIKWWNYGLLQIIRVENINKTFKLVTEIMYIEV